jgi:hypothetical protein
MNEELTFLEVLVKSIKAAGHFQPEGEIAPAAILWPDREREWEPLIPRLREHLYLLTLGPYAAHIRTGPPAWVRCMMAGALPEKLAPNVIPVLYLPGVSASELCSVEQRPKRLEPLVDVYYRGALWVNADSYDWTVAAFFQSQTIGPGVQLRDDDYTKKAMRRVLPALCDLSVGQLKGNEPWKARDFEELVSDIGKLIAMGESAELEFKSTARWHLVDNVKSPLMEEVILKTVAGFLNSARGGTLLIGVEDNGHVCGIEVDYQAFSKGRDHNPDAYERWLIGLLLNVYGHEFAPHLHVTFHSVDERTVCKVVVDPAPVPAFVGAKTDGKEEDIFYLRTGNATNSLRMRDFLAYYLTRWRT